MAGFGKAGAFANMVAPYTPEFKSKAQAGQDLFCAEVLGYKRDGWFLEIGSNNPVEINNTHALEKSLDWRGLGVDNSPESMFAWEQHRASPFYLTDAAGQQNWHAAIRQMYEIVGRRADTPLTLDYLSADIDGATLAFLQNFPFDQIKFRVITVEHDAYRNGPEYRQSILDIMQNHGYEVLCPDVADNGLSFEAWCVMPELVDMALAAKFCRSQPTEWREFFK